MQLFWFLCILIEKYRHSRFFCELTRSFVCNVCGFKGFPLWCMTWPRPHLEQRLAITTEERHNSMPLVSKTLWATMCKSVSRLRVLPLPQKAYVEALCVHFLCEYSCITLYDLNVRVSVTFSCCKYNVIEFKWCLSFSLHQCPVPNSRGRRVPCLGLPFMWRWQLRGRRGALQNLIAPPILNGTRGSLCKCAVYTWLTAFNRLCVEACHFI